MQITDDMCRRAIAAMQSDRIQGFSTRLPGTLTKFGAPHYIRDVTLAPDKQEIWRGDSQDEMLSCYVFDPVAENQKNLYCTCRLLTVSFGTFSLFFFFRVY